ESITSVHVRLKLAFELGSSWPGCEPTGTEAVHHLVDFFLVNRWQVEWYERRLFHDDFVLSVQLGRFGDRRINHPIRFKCPWPNWVIYTSVPEFPQLKKRVWLSFLFEAGGLEPKRKRGLP